MRNIIAGEKYVEPVGTMTVFNETTGAKAVASFKAKGMFSGRSEEVETQTIDPSGQDLAINLHGTWTNALELKEPGKIGQSTIWSAGALVDQAPKHYGMPLFAAELNEITDIERNRLPVTDSRLRPDQQALERGDHDEAESLKNQLEEVQRARRRDMEAAGETWKARWFTPVEMGVKSSGDSRPGKKATGRNGHEGNGLELFPCLMYRYFR